MKKFKLFGVTFGFVTKHGYVDVVISGTKLFYYARHRAPRHAMQHALSKLKFWASFLQVWPVYFVVFSRDCDLCESKRLVRAPNFFVGYRALRAQADDWTEGPFGFWQVSRREARSFEPEWRDRIGEAFDDGKGTHVIL